MRTVTSRLGPDLRQAREARGWALDAVAEHLRIRLPYLEAIEDGRNADLPTAAYAIGFIRAYAKLLDLDENEFARRFRAEAGEGGRRTELTFPAPVAERGVPALAVVAVGVVLVIGAYAAWYRLSGDQRPGPEAVQVVPDRLVPLVAERAAPPPAGGGAAATASLPPAAAVVGPLPVPAGSEEATPAGVAPPAPEFASVSPSQAAAAAPPPAARIVVRARSDSWIQVKDANGQLLLNRVLRGGESWPVPVRTAGAGVAPTLLLTTGNAGGTELVVDGVAAASLGNDGSVRRDLPLDIEAIRNGKLALSTVAPARVTPHNQ